MARIIFFSLFESPKFLVASGRPEEARVILQRIAAFNGQPLPVSLQDVRDDRSKSRAGAPATAAAAEEGVAGAESGGVAVQSGIRGSGRARGYDALPTEEATQRIEADDDEAGASRATVDNRNRMDMESGTRRESSSLLDRLPTSWQPGAAEFAARYAQLFEPHWRRTTILVWTIWTLVSLAFTIFNVFLPKFLEARLGSSDGGNSDGGPRDDRLAVMQDYLLYALASVPGSLLGAWMIETRLGRIGSMALSTACTALAILAFTAVHSRSGIVLSSMLISVSATTAYAAIYGYTPEVFTTDVRGTACGSASALSRLAGIVAPLIAGLLLAISINLPLFLSVVLFVVCVGCMLSLPYETRRDPSQTTLDLSGEQEEEEEGEAERYRDDLN